MAVESLNRKNFIMVMSFVVRLFTSAYCIISKHPSYRPIQICSVSTNYCYYPYYHHYFRQSILLNNTTSNTKCFIFGNSENSISIFWYVSFISYLNRQYTSTIIHQLVPPELNTKYQSIKISFLFLRSALPVCMIGIINTRQRRNY